MSKNDYRSEIDVVKKNLNRVDWAMDCLKKAIEERTIIRKRIRALFDDYLSRKIDESAKISGKKNMIKVENTYLSFNRNNYDQGIIDSVFNLYHLDMFKEEVDELYNSSSSMVEDIHRSIQPLLSNGISWMFTSSIKRNLSISAADSLYRLCGSNFLSSTDKLINTINDLNKGDSYKDFVENGDEYLGILNGIVRGHLYLEDDPPMPDFNLLKRFHTQFSNSRKQIEKASKTIGTIKANVIKDAYQIIDREVSAELQTMDIEIVFRSGIANKAKLLRKNGISNINDLMNISVKKLSSIYGISESSAQMIIDEGNRIKEDVRSNVGIKLDPDHKTIYETNLLRSLKPYWENLTDIRDAEATVEEYGSKVTPLLWGYDQFGDNVRWLTASYEQKKEICLAFESIDKTFDSNLIEKASDAYGISLKLRKTKEYDLSESDLWDDFNSNSSKIYSALEDLCPGLFGNDDACYGLSEEFAEEIEKENVHLKGLKSTLRRYQEWGVKYILHQKKLILGDEMGLGKTIQSIAAMVTLRNEGETHFMVVCPASVIINWCREIELHSDLMVFKIHGNDKKNAFDCWKNCGGVAVTTYETVGGLSLDEGFVFSMLTVDEAHYCKNPKAKRTSNIIDLGKHADRILYMTGTALENRIEEMKFLISQLNEDVFEMIKDIEYITSAKGFKNKVIPVYYRRKRDEVLSELPDLIESEEWCSMSDQEVEFYCHSLIKRNFMSIRRVSWDIDDLAFSCKAKRLKEIVDMAREDGRKIIVFSFFLETLSKIRGFLGDVCTKPINGSVTPKERQRIIDEFDDAEDGTVLLAQIQSGGIGLNIQSASVVVIAEPQFKPSIENQAISRAYRMGQTRNVLVYRLLCEDSIDEYLVKLLEEKQRIFNAFADESIAAEVHLEIDEKTFGKLIDDEIDRIINCKKSMEDYSMP